jgi:hypothetical protein
MFRLPKPDYLIPGLGLLVSNSALHIWSFSLAFPKSVRVLIGGIDFLHLISFQLAVLGVAYALSRVSFYYFSAAFAAFYFVQLRTRLKTIRRNRLAVLWTKRFLVRNSQVVIAVLFLLLYAGFAFGLEDGSKFLLVVAFALFFVRIIVLFSMFRISFSNVLRALVSISPPEVPGLQGVSPRRYIHSWLMTLVIGSNIIAIVVGGFDRNSRLNSFEEFLVGGQQMEASAVVALDGGLLVFQGPGRDCFERGCFWLIPWEESIKVLKK